MSNKEENTYSGERTEKKNQYKIDRETALTEFIRYCDNNEFEYEESAMTEEEKESFSDIKKRFIKCCMEGRVEIDGTNLVYTVSKLSPEGYAGDTVTVKRPGGHAFTSMDNFKERESIHKLHGFMSAITGKEIKYFAKVDISDWKFLQAIASLFLSL